MKRIRKILKKMMIVLLTLLGIVVLVGYLFMQQASFGKLPSGARLERIKKSPHYKDGAFQNFSPTPNFTGGAGFFTVMRDFMFGKHERKTPDYDIPSVKRDLKVHPSLKPEITWFGHSSYLLQVNNLNILVDPVFSERTSPVQ
ncbi:MAG: MBL fold metallo-hydrolase, partial [Sphingobacteriales bacterium]